MKIPSIGLLAASLIGLAACDGSTAATDRNTVRVPIVLAASPDEPCSSFSSTFVVKDRMDQAVTRFVAREPITLEFKITNNASVTKTLVGYGCDFLRLEVDNKSSGRTVYSSTDGVTCDPPASAAVIHYDPGESRIYSSTWQQIDRNGQQVPNGNYLAYVFDASQCKAALNKTSDFSIQ